MVATRMLCQNGRSPSARCHGCHMRALRDPTEFVGTLSWLAHGCSAKNGRTLCGRYNGCHMDALQKRTNSLWMLSWLPQGCSAKTDGVLLHVVMVATCVLCGTRRSLWERYHGWHMDALQKTAELFVDVIMVATWMLCKNGRTLCGRYHGCHMDALPKRKESFCTLSWLPHGCSAKTDGVLLHVIMVATWMLCGTRRSLSGRSEGWHMGALSGNGRTLRGRQPVRANN